MQSGQWPAMEGLLTDLETIPAAPSSPPAIAQCKAVLKLLKLPPETKGWQAAAEDRPLSCCLRQLSADTQDIGRISTIQVAFARQASRRGE